MTQYGAKFQFALIYNPNVIHRLPLVFLIASLHKCSCSAALSQPAFSQAICTPALSSHFLCTSFPLSGLFVLKEAGRMRRLHGHNVRQTARLKDHRLTSWGRGVRDWTAGQEGHFSQLPCLDCSECSCTVSVMSRCSHWCVRVYLLFRCT